jgi:ABC-type uncharacterized transport system permease subunit
MDLLTNWLAFTPVFAMPLVAAALGLIINERAGLLNLGAEGIMLCGALVAVIAYIEFGDNLALGFISGILAGSLLGFVFGFLVVVLRTNQVVIGITFVILGSGLTGLLGIPWVNIAITGINPIHIPFLTDIPLIGRFLFGQDLVVYATLILAALTWRFLFRTRMGLELRAVGENPQAADADGINVEAYRFHRPGRRLSIARYGQNLCSRHGSGPWVDRHCTGYFRSLATMARRHGRRSVRQH